MRDPDCRRVLIRLRVFAAEDGGNVRVADLEQPDRLWFAPLTVWVGRGLRG